VEETAPQGAAMESPPGESASPSAAELTQAPIEQTDASQEFASAFESYAERGDSPPAADETTDGESTAADGKEQPAATGRDAKGRFLPKGEQQPAPDDAATEPAAEEPKAEVAPADPDEQYRQFIARYEREQTEKAERERAAAEVKQQADAALEAFSGKPGELEGLLKKETDQGYLDMAENDRKLALLRNRMIAAPLQERIRAGLEAEYGPKLRDAEGRLVGTLENLSGQLRTATALVGVDAAVIEGDGTTLEAALKHVHEAGHKTGAASRDGEVEDLKAQLAEARGLAFRSQPPLVTAGGSSPGSTGRPGVAPDASPQESMAAAFEQLARGAQNGRRF
jgi:hypothetical protein